MNDFIDFSIGMSDPDSFPTEEFAEAAAKAVRKVGDKFAYYPGAFGYPRLRRLMASRESKREGVSYDPEQLALTNGSMQAVTLAAQGLVRKPGDLIVCEENTYSATIGAYKGIGAQLVGVPVDHEGMQVDVLADTLQSLQDQATPPAFVYTIPTYQNPTAAVMPLSRREQLIETARRFDVTIVEDNCYADVRFEGEVPPALYSLTGGEGIVYLGSLSKIFAAGVRMGYLIAKPPLLEEILAKRFDNGPSTLTASVLAAYLEEHMWEHIDRQNKALTAKRDALLEVLHSELSEHCSWLDPVGGLFLWLRLPGSVSIERLTEAGKQEGVGFAPGSAFHIDNADIPYIRLAFGHPTPQTVREGALRLSRAIKAVAREETAIEAAAGAI